jgi:hypothetical protein
MYVDRFRSLMTGHSDSAVRRSAGTAFLREARDTVAARVLVKEELSAFPEDARFIEETVFLSAEDFLAEFSPYLTEEL